jgi:hypothetical protein
MDPACLAANAQSAGATAQQCEHYKFAPSVFIVAVIGVIVIVAAASF